MNAPETGGSLDLPPLRGRRFLRLVTFALVVAVPAAGIAACSAQGTDGGPVMYLGLPGIVFGVGLLFALAGGATQRSLRVDAAGLAVGVRGHRWSVAWEHVAMVTTDGRGIHVRMREGAPPPVRPGRTPRGRPPELWPVFSENPGLPGGLRRAREEQVNAALRRLVPVLYEPDGGQGR